MIHHLRSVLDADALVTCRRLLAQAPWGDGRVTAGTQSAQVKNNVQLPEDCEIATQMRSLVLQSLSRNGQFFSAALPRRIYPPLFNRYAGEHNWFGNHVDNAIRTHPSTAQHVRTDLSFTLFLNDPSEYEGGELVIEQGYDSPRVKLPAGDLILYPSYSVHRVESVTRGQRLACFSWVESMVRDPAQRDLLFEIDLAILELRATAGECSPVVNLTSQYHNLLRMWAQV